jgi:PAS domain S-box-containing protein
MPVGPMKRDANELLTALARASRAAGNASSTKELLQLVSAQAAELTGATRSLLLLADESGILRIRAQCGMDRMTTASFAAPLASGDGEQLLRQIAPLLGYDASDDVLVAPLPVLGQVTGFLAVGPADVGTPSGDRQSILTALASQVAGPLKCTSLAAEIRESQLLAETAEQATGVGVLTWNVVTGERSWSPEIYRLHGLDPGQPASHDAWRAVVHPDDVARILADDPEAWTRPRDGAAAPPGFREEEYRVVLPDGKVRWIASRTRLVQPDDGRPAQVVGVAFDITERKRVEEAVSASEQRFRLATGALVGFLYDWEPATDRLQWFGGLEDVLGFRLGEVKPDAGWWQSRVHPEDVERATDDTRAALASDARGYSHEYRVLHRDGHYVFIADRGNIVRDEEGHAIRVLGGVTDISERRYLELERETLLLEERHARAAAERAARARDEVLGIVTHDLRAPLSVIAIAAKTLADTAPTAESAREIANLLQRSTDWMGRMIDDLLDVAKIETGRLGLILRDEQPHAILFQAALMFTTSAREVGIDLSVQAPHDLPAVHVDAQRLLQALGNLVTNALKASEPGDRIELRAESGAKSVRFTVEDTGRGIAPETLAELLDHVSRQHRRARAGGVGLGLAIARGIIGAHGGHLTAESTPGSGSRFTFTIPVARR